MNRRIDDDQIKAFLKKNQPVAPAIDETKVHASLLSKLGFGEPVRRSRSVPWLAFSGAIAASILAVLMFPKPLIDQNPTLATPVAVTESDWSDEVFADDELPALEVGEDYLELMASNDTTGRVTK